MSERNQGKSDALSIKNGYNLNNKQIGLIHMYICIIAYVYAYHINRYVRTLICNNIKQTVHDCMCISIHHCLLLINLFYWWLAFDACQMFTGLMAVYIWLCQLFVNSHLARSHHPTMYIRM